MDMHDVVPAPDLQPVSFDSPERDLVEVGRYATVTAAAERGLVVLATGHAYWQVEEGGAVRVLVEPAALDAARVHLAAFERESTRWPPPPIADPWTRRKFDLITPMLWAVAVLAIFEAGTRWPAWVERGLLQPRAVFVGGEGWRPVTALFLHASAAHLFSNLLGGLLVFSAVLFTMGRARGWLLLLATSVAANLAAAAANFGQPYSSLGASTAVFAGVGLLSGRAIRVAWRSTHPHRWRAMFAPLAAGVTVLALYGAGEQRVDVGAHLSGFVAGLIGGFIAGLSREVLS